jgi:hypothetical protein
MAKRKVGVKLAIWLLTIKSRESLDFLACKWHATYHWKAFDKNYNFALDFIPTGGLHTMLWASKVVGVPILGILGLPLGSPGTKWHLGAGPLVKHKIYYKGEGGGFPQVRALVNLMSLCLFVARWCTKSVLVMH